MQNGGKRPGAGRKKGFKALAAEKARELLVKRVTEEWGPLIQAKLDLALGRNGLSPDRASLEYLINQVIGRPIERIGDPEGKALPFTLIIQRQDENQ